jgi:hypothetical protein
LVFAIDIFDFAEVTEQNAAQSAFLVDDTSSCPHNVFEVKLDDNFGLDCGLDAFSQCCDGDFLVDSASPFCPVDLPWQKTECSELELLTACVERTNPGSHALHGMDVMVWQTKLNKSAIYKQLRNEEASLSPDAPPRAHANGGAMASTTDCLSLLWYLRNLQGTPPALTVADNRKHYPTAVGFLHVPTQDYDGYKMVKCFYTPTLSTTIISLDAMTCAFGCCGYTSISNLDGRHCQLSLHHCRCILEDVVIPLTLVHGLLYTEPLLAPSTDSEQLGPMP